MTEPNIVLFLDTTNYLEMECYKKIRNKHLKCRFGFYLLL